MVLGSVDAVRNGALYLLMTTTALAGLWVTGAALVLRVPSSSSSTATAPPASC